MSTARVSFTWILRLFGLYWLFRLWRARQRWLRLLEHGKLMEFPVATFDSILSKTMLGHIPVIAQRFHTVYDLRLETHEKYGPSFLWTPPVWNPHPTLSTIEPEVSAQSILC